MRYVARHFMVLALSLTGLNAQAESYFVSSGGGSVPSTGTSGTINTPYGSPFGSGTANTAAGIVTNVNPVSVGNSSGVNTPNTFNSVNSASGGNSSGASDSGGPTISGNANAVGAILHPSNSQAANKSTNQTYTAPKEMTQKDLNNRLINDSLNGYLGYCACPYSKNQDGFECGVESAYYRPGGYRIKCFPQDSKGQDKIFYRKNH